MQSAATQFCKKCQQQTFSTTKTVQNGKNQGKLYNQCNQCNAFISFVYQPNEPQALTCPFPVRDFGETKTFQLSTQSTESTTLLREIKQALNENNSLLKAFIEQK